VFYFCLSEIANSSYTNLPLYAKNRQQTLFLRLKHLQILFYVLMILSGLLRVTVGASGFIVVKPMLIGAE
jgi:hypothetical protein